MGLQESLDWSLGFFQRESIRVLLWNHCVHEVEQVCSSLLCRLADFAPTLPHPTDLILTELPLMTPSLQTVVFRSVGG